MAQNTPAGFRFSGGNCCCCWDYYIQTIPGGTKYPIGFRRMRTSGDYENLVVDIDEKNVAGRPPSNGLGIITAFRFDYRHKMGFYQAAPIPRPTGNHFVLMKCDPALQHKEQIGAFVRSFAPAGSAVVNNGLIACDYVNERLVYVNTASVTTYDPMTFDVDVVQEIRSVRYDGTDDTLIHTETSRGDEGAGLGINHVVFEPHNERLYFATRRTDKYGGGDYNSFAYIKYVDALTGGNYTTLFSYEDTVNVVGNYDVLGLTVSGRQQKLLWVLRHQVDNIQQVWASDFDGSNDAVVYDPGVVTPTASNLRFNERDDYMIYERQRASGDSLRVTYRIDWGATDEQSVFDSRQISLADEEENFYAGAFGAQFGCRKEITGHEYMGAG